MRFKTVFSACMLVVLLLSCASASITLSYPVTEHFGKVIKDADYPGDFRVLEGKKLGAVAPGQTLKLVFSRDTGSTFLWEKIRSNASPSWNERISIGDNIIVTLIIPADAEEGEHVLNFTGTAAYEAGTVKTPEIVSLKFHITKGVYSVEIEPVQSLYVDYPNSVFFKIESLSIASDVVTFTLANFPSKWYKPLQTEIKPLEERRMFFSITPAEEKEYSAQLVASRESGFSDSYSLTLKVRPATLQTKLKALGEGFSIIPVLLQPFYSLLSLFGLAC